jgi:hypothetical protein
MSLRRIERYLGLSIEVKALEALDDSLVALYPTLTTEGRSALENLWKERAGMQTIRSGDNLPLIRWGNALRMFIGAPLLAADDPAAGDPLGG